jgi:hypothetical protein
MALDDELRRMFADADDERLDVPVRPDAEQLIVAGARRVRRRRIATVTASGAAAAVALVFAGIALAGGSPDAMPPAIIDSTTVTPPPPSGASSTTSTSATSAQNTSVPNTDTGTNEPAHPPDETQQTIDREAPPKLDFEVLGPTGIRSLQLNQSLDSAQTTAMIGDRDESGGIASGGLGCDLYPLLLDGTPVGLVHISASDGANQVEAIQSAALKTPEGVGRGWQVKQVVSVYPDVDEDFVRQNGRGYAAVPGNPGARYRIGFDMNNYVTDITLQNQSQPCYE